jgi:hypothetical protein
MRRPLALLCLMAALVAPLLCQAEAADELARSLAELVVPSVLEPSGTDGCTGLCQATMKAEVHPGVGLDTSPEVPPGAILAAIVPPAPSRRPDGPRAPGSAAWPSDLAPRRQARLQVFLF